MHLDQMDLDKMVDLSAQVEKDMKENPHLFDTLGIPDDIDWFELDLKKWKRPEKTQEQLEKEEEEVRDPFIDEIKEKFASMNKIEL